MAKEKPTFNPKIATPDNVREFLAVDDEKMQEYQEQHLKLYRSRARLTHAERVLGRGIELEQHFRQVGKPDGLAEALEMQGRYDEAAAVAVKPELKASLTEKAQGMRNTKCDCDAIDAKGEPNSYKESVTFVNGKPAVLVRCTKCNSLYLDPNGYEEPKKESDDLL